MTISLSLFLKVGQADVTVGVVVGTRLLLLEGMVEWLEMVRCSCVGREVAGQDYWPVLQHDT